MIKKKFPPLRPKQFITTQPKEQPQYKTSQSNILYADMIKSHINHQNTNPKVSTNKSDDISELKNMMKSLIEQMCTMLNLLTTIVMKMN